MKNKNDDDLASIQLSIHSTTCVPADAFRPSLQCVLAGTHVVEDHVVEPVARLQRAVASVERAHRILLSERENRERTNVWLASAQRDDARKTTVLTTRARRRSLFTARSEWMARRRANTAGGRRERKGGRSNARGSRRRCQLPGWFCGRRCDST